MSASDYVFLSGGLTVPLPALQVLWDLENRGVSFALEGDGIIARSRAKRASCPSKSSAWE